MIYTRSSNTDIVDALRNDFRAYGYETFTVTTSALPITVPEGCRYCLIQVESTNTVDAIRYRLDGGNPTASVGVVRANMDTFDIVEAQNIKNLRVIKGTGAGTTTLNIQYFK